MRALRFMRGILELLVSPLAMLMATLSRATGTQFDWLILAATLVLVGMISVTF